MSKSFSYSRCEAFANAVNSLPADDNQAALDLVNAHGLTRGDFVELDERPGQFDVGAGNYNREQWHRRLRVVRNDRDNDLFDRLS